MNYIIKVEDTNSNYTDCYDIADKHALFEVRGILEALKSGELTSFKIEGGDVLNIVKELSEEDGRTVLHANMTARSMKQKNTEPPKLGT